MTQPMAGAAAATRRQQRIDDLCAAAIRAVSGVGGLHFRGRRLYLHDQPLQPLAPHLKPQPRTDDFASFRGAADAMALRVRWCDAALHQRLRPSDPLACMLFDMLEQFRVESLAPADMPGMAHNLRHRFEVWSLAFFNSGLTETARGMLLYTVVQICRSRLTAQPVLEASEGAIESTRMSLGSLLGTDLAGLRRMRHDQEGYAAHALRLVDAVHAMLIAGDEGEDAAGATNDTEAINARKWFSLWMDVEGEGDEGFATAGSGQSRLLAQSAEAYRVFIRDFDVEIEAASQVRPELLDEYRDRLDRRIEQQSIQHARLARAWQAVLCTPWRNGWVGAQEEGYIDGRQLSRLITSPDERHLFQREQYTPQADAMVSFLIDCSGSMRQHAEAVAMLVDVTVRALDQIGVASEVLGFTTNAWNGGRAQRAWLRAGKPPHPGRLNECCHLVFKDSQTPWRRARRAMAAILKPDLFREGVDGEAVQWAVQRLLERHEGRRILLVVSDGSPTDTATALANDVHYLDHHLSHVVAQSQARGLAEIYGIGVGLDLSPYYLQNRAFDLTSSVSNAVLQEIITMVAAGPGMQR